MTLKEAQTIAKIIDTADGGCCVCVRSLCEQMQEAFPMFTWSYPEDYADIVVTPSKAARDESEQ